MPRAIKDGKGAVRTHIHTHTHARTHARTLAQTHTHQQEQSWIKKARIYSVWVMGTNVCKVCTAVTALHRCWRSLVRANELGLVTSTHTSGCFDWLVLPSFVLFSITSTSTPEGRLRSSTSPKTGRGLRSTVIKPHDEAEGRKCECECLRCSRNFKCCDCSTLKMLTMGRKTERERV